MFVTRRKYDAVTKEMGRQIVERDDTAMLRDATITAEPDDPYDTARDRRRDDRDVHGLS